MRQYLVGSWANADSYDYSGEQLMGNRLGASRDASHFLKNGQANTAKYGDNTEASVKRKTSVPLRQRILPQEARLTTLDTQIEELNQEYNSNRMSYEEYAHLKTILQRKRDRAWELYVKAGGIVSVTSQNNDESEEFGVEYITQNSVTEVGCGVSCGVAWVDELSAKNTFKKMLQNTCKASRTLVKLSQRAKAYYQELKEV